MGTHKDSLIGNLAEHFVENSAINPFVDWVHPDQHTINPAQLIADFTHEFIGVNGGFSFDTNTDKPAVSQRHCV